MLPTPLSIALSTEGWFGPINLCVLGAGALLFGLTTALFPTSLRFRWVLTLLVSGLCGLGLVGSVAAVHPWVWQPSLSLAALVGLCSFFRSSWPERFAGRSLRLLASPLLQALFLLVGGAGLLIVQVATQDSGFLEGIESELVPELTPVELSPAQAGVALTDAGNSVPLFAASVAQEAVNLRREEEMVVRRLSLGTQLIRTAGPGLEANCHGWVFAGGRHWLRGGAIAGILTDNGYKLVSRPQVNDLIIYRNPQGQISHSGVVRALLPSGVLIESKWGQMGRFLHTPGESCYRGHTYLFYHSERTTHLLRGLEGGEGLPGPDATEPQDGA
jgi:hypothetical protein